MIDGFLEALGKKLPPGFNYHTDERELQQHSTPGRVIAYPTRGTWGSWPGKAHNPETGRDETVLFSRRLPFEVRIWGQGRAEAEAMMLEVVSAIALITPIDGVVEDWPSQPEYLAEGAEVILTVIIAQPVFKLARWHTLERVALECGCCS